MAITVTPLTSRQGMKSTFRPEFMHAVTITLDGNYIAAGYALQTLMENALGMGKFTTVAAQEADISDYGYRIAYDAANDKLKVIDNATNTELAGGSAAVAGVTVDLLILAI